LFRKVDGAPVGDGIVYLHAEACLQINRHPAPRLLIRLILCRRVGDRLARITAGWRPLAGATVTCRPAMRRAS